MHRSAAQVVRSVVERLSSKTARQIHAFDAPARGDNDVHRLLRHVPGMVFRCDDDPARTMEFVSDGCRALTGFAPQDLVDSRIVAYGSLIHPEDRLRVRDEVLGAVRLGQPFRVSYRLRGVDGRERHVQEVAQPIIKDGGAVSIEGFVGEVTDRDALIERASDQEARLRGLIEQSLVGVYIVSEGRFEYVNPCLAEIFGYTVEEVLSLPSIHDLVHPDDRGLVAANVSRRLDRGAEAIRYEFRGRHRDGSNRFVEVHGRRLERAGKPAILGTLVDNTERKLSERRHHEADKLDALGRLATGVAHDLNNFLAVIKSTAQLLLAERPSDPALAKDIAEIISAADRGSSLGQQLMSFSRARARSGSVASLGETVTGMAPLLERILGRTIGLRLEIPTGLPPVGIEASRVEEIVMNLILNAQDAMPAGGVVTIAARQGSASTPLMDDGRGHVILEVTDTGAGITEEVQRRMFEPFFTTKGERGTGLGLANTWSIVASAGGAVDVDSRVGQGTTFRVILPSARVH